MFPTIRVRSSALLRSTLLAGLASAALLPAAAQAGDEGDQNFIRVGWERAVFHDQNSGFTGAGIPPGVSLQTQTEDLNAVFFGYARAVSDHGEISLVLGVPPTFHVHARGPATIGAVPYNGQPVSSGRQMAPSISYNYKFNEPGAFYRPYLGVGLVYSHFYDIQVAPQANAINGGPTAITYEDCWGIRITAGVSLKVAEHLYGSLSVSKADVSPSVTTNTLGSIRTNTYQLNPVVWAAQVSYGF